MKLYSKNIVVALILIILIHASMASDHPKLPFDRFEFSFDRSYGLPSDMHPSMPFDPGMDLLAFLNGATRTTGGRSIPCIDLTDPNVLGNNVTIDDALKVLLVQKTNDPSDVMYNIAFDESVLFFLLPEDIKTEDELIDFESVVLPRFFEPSVCGLIQGMRRLYWHAMQDIDYDRGAFAKILRVLNESERALVIPFRLNLNIWGLNLLELFSDHDAEAETIEELGKIAKIQQSVATRRNQYAPDIAKTLRSEYAARQSVLNAHASRAASSASGRVVIDPTDPAVLNNDATLADAMAVLLIRKANDPSGEMYDIAFDESVLLGLLPETQAMLRQEKLRNFDSLLSRFHPSVRNLIDGMRFIYLGTMRGVGCDKDTFAETLRYFKESKRALAVPFRLNPDVRELNFLEPFFDHDAIMAVQEEEKFRKMAERMEDELMYGIVVKGEDEKEAEDKEIYEHSKKIDKLVKVAAKTREEMNKFKKLEQSIRARKNKFLAPGETRTFDAEDAARKRVLDAHASARPADSRA